MPRKTFNINGFVEMVNNSLATCTSTADYRRGIMTVVEHVLFVTQETIVDSAISRRKKFLLASCQA